MNAATTLRPKAIAASEPVAVAAAVRALLYLGLTKLGVDPPTMVLIVTVLEGGFAYLTRKVVTPTCRPTSSTPTDATDEHAEQPADVPLVDVSPVTVAL